MNIHNAMCDSIITELKKAKEAEALGISSLQT